LLVPKKYLTIKDDIPRLHLNTELNEENKNYPKTIPTDFEYEIPLSLNAETCFSEFVNVEKNEKSNSNKQGKINSMFDDMCDTSDLLYNAHTEG